MPLRVMKTEDKEGLTIERAMYVRRHSLVVSKDLCRGCDICRIACPKEAIKLVPRMGASKGAQEGIMPPFVDIEVEKCNFCGICDVLCPFGAARSGVDGQHVVSVIETESFPSLVRDIKIDSKKCDVGCTLCADVCPLGIIDVKVEEPRQGVSPKVEFTINEERCNLCGLCAEICDALGVVENLPKPEGSGKIGFQADRCDGCGLCVDLCPTDAITIREIPLPPSKKSIIKLAKERCPCCKLCEVVCPPTVLQIRKTFYGTIKINQEKCPEGCKDCVEACPLDIMYLKENGKVDVIEAFCVYCGVCLNVCPEKDALKVTREYILHTPIRSGAWNKALERLTSIESVDKELRAKSLLKMQENVRKRIP